MKLVKVLQNCVYYSSNMEEHRGPDQTDVRKILSRMALHKSRLAVQSWQRHVRLPEDCLLLIWCLWLRQVHSADTASPIMVRY
jgi:hypothetical protein